MNEWKIKFNDYTPPVLAQDGYKPSFAVTSTANSGRTMRGTMINTTMFTVEAYDLKWDRITAQQVSEILQEIVGYDSFNFTYYSVFYNRWLTAPFYVANVNSINITSLVDGEEKVMDLSFQVTGINPVR